LINKNKVLWQYFFGVWSAWSILMFLLYFFLMQSSRKAIDENEYSALELVAKSVLMMSHQKPANITKPSQFPLIVDLLDEECCRTKK